MIFAHGPKGGGYTSLSCSDSDKSYIHEHTMYDVLPHGPGDLDLDPVPALLEDGNTWAISCTAACEAASLLRHQFTANDPKAVPMTADELRVAEQEAKRAEVEEKQLVRAMYGALMDRARADEAAQS